MWPHELNKSENNGNSSPVYQDAIKAVLCILCLLAPFFSTTALAEDSATTNPATDRYTETVNALNTKSFKKKALAVTELANLNDKRTLDILQAFLDSRLYYRKSDKIIVIIKETADDYEITNAITKEKFGVVGKREIKKIRTNNKLRKQLRGIIAQLSLSSEDPAIRLEAVNEITRDLDESSISVLKQALGKEKDSSVIEAIEIALAFSGIDSNDKTVRLDSIKLLKDSLRQEAKARLADLIKQNEDGSYAEQDVDVRLAAKKAIAHMEGQFEFYAFLEKIFFGLSLGSVLLLAAIGLAITFGVMGVINMAHGELIMIGAYTTYVVQLLMPENIAMSLFVAVPAAFLVSGLFGIAIERGVIRFLYGRPLETLLATFGISLVLQQLVRSIFSPLNRSVETPAWMSGSLEINAALSLTYNRLYIIAFSLLVFYALHLILKKTTLGLKVRAVSQNRNMAKAMGTRAEWVDALTFGLGSGIAGVAGVALSQLTNVGPNLGQSYIIDSFMVVVFGGVGNIGGTLVGAMSLGIINKFLEPWAGAVLAKIIVLIFIILFIQKRPRGLFPQKGRAAEN
jgi:urea transport system permease protein